MKKIAFISGLLFLVVYFCVNTFTPDEDAFEVIYSSVPVRTFSAMENPVSLVTDNPGPITDDLNPVEYTYVIVASFRNPEQANRVAEEFTGKYNADMFVLPPASNGYYRVSYGRYSAAGDALAVLESLKQTYFPDAWLLQSK